MRASSRQMREGDFALDFCRANGVDYGNYSSEGPATIFRRSGMVLSCG